MKSSPLCLATALTALSLLLIPVEFAHAGGCMGCAAQPSGLESNTVSTVVNGVQSDVTLEINITVYGANCEEVFPLVCEADEPCKIYADGSYWAEFGGLDFSSYTAQYGTKLLKANLGPAPSGSGFGSARVDRIDCGVVDHEIRFSLSWTSDGLSPSEVSVDATFGCSGCLFKLS
ncbi:MAG: hypothetical protein H8D72_01400 [Planctomycetes bacterium]|nr:hypothetical protein [Planctomycetota bacterium]